MLAGSTMADSTRDLGRRPAQNVNQHLLDCLILGEEGQIIVIKLTGTARPNFSSSAMMRRLRKLVSDI